jgi:hypothetical protein
MIVALKTIINVRQTSSIKILYVVALLAQEGHDGT